MRRAHRLITNTTSLALVLESDYGSMRPLNAKPVNTPLSLRSAIQGQLRTGMFASVRLPAIAGRLRDETCVQQCETLHRAQIVTLPFGKAVRQP